MTAQNLKVQLERSWLAELGSEFEQPYMRDLKSFLLAEKKKGKEIFPRGAGIFSALNQTPLSKVRVVVVGQDPYHGPNQAHGMCFSVRRGVPVPPSLKNIYKELYSDLGIAPAEHGNLESWALQGVLLLNNVLTVEKGLAGSHRQKGWEIFTDRIVQILNQKKSNLVFILWGRDAQTKCAKVDEKKHLLLKAAHPSPFSATAFLGCKHFSKANQYLVQQGLGAIDWRLS